MEELNTKERSCLRMLLKEHQTSVKEQMQTASKKDSQSLKKELDRVNDIIHKLKLN